MSLVLLKRELSLASADLKTKDDTPEEEARQAHETTADSWVQRGMASRRRL